MDKAQKLFFGIEEADKALITIQISEHLTLFSYCNAKYTAIVESRTI